MLDLTRMGTNLRIAMARRNISPTKLAEMSGVGYRTITAYMRSNSPTGTIEAWSSISAALGHSGIDWLMVAPDKKESR